MSETSAIIRPGQSRAAGNPALEAAAAEIQSKGFLVTQVDKLVNWARTRSEEHTSELQSH